jgi:hypothetical protein
MSIMTIYATFAICCISGTEPSIHDLQFGWNTYDNTAFKAQGRLEEVVTGRDGKVEGKTSIRFDSGLEAFRSDVENIFFLRSGTRKGRQTYVANEKYAFLVTFPEDDGKSWVLHNVAQRAVDESTYRELLENAIPNRKMAATRLYGVRLYDVTKSNEFKVLSLAQANVDGHSNAMQLSFQYSFDPNSPNVLRFPVRAGVLTMDGSNQFALLEAHLEWFDGNTVQVKQTYGVGFDGIMLPTVSHYTTLDKDRKLNGQATTKFFYGLSEPPLTRDVATLAAFGFKEPIANSGSMFRDRRLWLLVTIGLSLVAVFAFRRFSSNRQKHR